MRRPVPAASPLRVVLLLVAAGALGGCRSPEVVFLARTTIGADGTTERAVQITLDPPKGIDPKSVQVTDILRLPPEEAYQRYDVEAHRVILRGTFPSPHRVPVDFMKKTAGVPYLAQNSLRVRRRDYVLLTAYDVEERVDDIVERAEADEALDRALGLLVAVLVEGLEAEFGEDYDLAELSAWLHRTLPSLGRDLYQIHWELRRSRRGGLDPELEVREWDRRLRQAISRYGLYLDSFADRDGREANKKRAWDFLDQKLKELVTPRREGVKLLTSEAFRSAQRQAELLQLAQAAVAERYGSLDEFLQEIDALLPVIFGAYFPRRLRPGAAEPTFRFVFRLQVPGWPIQSNALQDLDGSYVWNFDTESVQLTGYPMWVRTIDVDRDAVRRLGLEGFPGSLQGAERFRAVMTDPDQTVDPAMAALLERCVREGGLKTLRVAGLRPAEVQAELALPADVRPLTAGRAQMLLGVLSTYRSGGAEAPPRQRRTPGPVAPPVAPGEEPPAGEEDAAAPSAAAPTPDLDAGLASPAGESAPAAPEAPERPDLDAPADPGSGAPPPDADQAEESADNTTEAETPEGPPAPAEEADAGPPYTPERIAPELE